MTTPNEKSNDELLDEAKEAATKLFGDTSVSKSETVSQLYDLKDHIQTLIDAVESDIARENNE